MSRHYRQKESHAGGVSASTVLGLIFLVLKLTGQIDWSWWLVLLPFYWWLPVFVVVVAAVGFAHWRGRK